MPRRNRSAGKNAIGDLSDPVLISTLSGWLEESGARELEILTDDGDALKIVLDPGARSARMQGDGPDMVETRTEGCAVKAPIAGVFRGRHPCADAPPLAAEGDAVEADAVVGFVEVGPLLLPVIAPETAVVAKVHARAGDLVGYGDVILTMEPVR